MDTTHGLAAILRDAREGALVRMRTASLSLTRSQAPGESFDIDETAGVAAFADAALVVEGFDLEADHAPLHGNDPRGGAHFSADRSGGKVADIDLGADRDPARLQIVVDGVAG